MGGTSDVKAFFSFSFLNIVTLSFLYFHSILSDASKKKTFDAFEKGKRIFSAKLFFLYRNILFFFFFFSTSLDVGREIDLVRQLRDVDLEPVLDLVEDLGVGLVGDEGDGQALGAEATGAGHAVEVGVSVLGHVVVEHDVHALDVHSAAEQVRRDQDSL